jgi:DNA-binding XRE family transcriptional regulator
MNEPFANAWAAQRAAIGAYIRSQRELSSLSLRELARLTQVSNAYLSQLERGLHDPSLRVLVSIAAALNISVEDLLQRARESTGDTGSGGPAGAGGAGGSAGAGGAGGSAGAGGAGGGMGVADTEAAIRDDPNLSTAEKEALLSVYRSYRRGRETE